MYLKHIEFLYGNEEFIGKTAEEFKTYGASVNDRNKVLKEYNVTVSARIFDCMGISHQTFTSTPEMIPLMKALMTF